jgi:pilus assembly protein CpaB
LKRSNRIVLLIGILLAVVAFVAVIVLFNQQKPAEVVLTTTPTVYARTNIALGSVITQDMLETRDLDNTVRPADAFGDVGLVVGKTARADIPQGALITSAYFSAGAGGQTDVAALLEPGLRAIAVQVDQVSGVGTLINVGDRVDVVLGLTGADKFPLVTIDPTTEQLTGVANYNTTSTKLLLQNMQVIGTLVPPAETTSGSSGTSTSSGPALTGAQQLVILAVSAQQAEVIKFAQMDGQISLVLRSPADFRDANGNPVTPQGDQTSGVVLRTLIDQYGVLPPNVIQANDLPVPAAQ